MPARLPVQSKSPFAIDPRPLEETASATEELASTVQHNAENAAQVKRFLAILKSKGDYVVAAPEYIDKTFSTVIKFYNYTNADEEKNLVSLINRQFNIPADKILVKHEKNPNIKSTVEVWIGTRATADKAL